MPIISQLKNKDIFLQYSNITMALYRINNNALMPLHTVRIQIGPLTSYDVCAVDCQSRTRGRATCSIRNLFSPQQPIVSPCL